MYSTIFDVDGTLSCPGTGAVDHTTIVAMEAGTAPEADATMTAGTVSAKWINGPLNSLRNYM